LVSLGSNRPQIMALIFISRQTKVAVEEEEAK
jgi:hypothetical protein